MTEKGQVKITTAKPIVGKKVFYFIQSIQAEKGEGALLPAYRTDGTTTLGSNTRMSKHNKVACLKNQVTSTQSN